MILFVIQYSEKNVNGIGGTFQDVRALSQIMNGSRILVLGDALPQAFHGLENVDFCAPSWLGILTFFRSNRDNLKHLEVVHAYDRTAAILGSWLAIWRRVPLVVTKAGGPPVKEFYPEFTNLVVVQQSDFDLLLGRKNGPQNIALIPNRVDRRLRNDGRKSPFSNLRPNAIKLLCIARICPEYVSTIKQAFLLQRFLEESGIACELSVVGEVSNAESLRTVQGFITDGHSNILTDWDYIENAADLIYMADISVGAGRVAMESMAVGVLTCVPCATSDMPCLIDEDTYPYAAAVNFSHRLVVPLQTVEIKLKSLICILNDTSLKDEYKKFLSEKFEKDCYVGAGVEKLKYFYFISKKETIHFKLQYFAHRVFAHAYHKYWRRNRIA